MNYKFIFLLWILFLLTFSSVQAVVTIYPTGVEFYVENETYTTSRKINFSYVAVTPTTITFNWTTFNIESANPITIEIERVSEDNYRAGEPLVRFNASTVAPIVSFNLSGFRNSSSCELYVDDTFSQYLQASAFGVVNFTYDAFSKHTFAIFGLFNYTHAFTVRYENYSQGLVNISKWGPHSFIVQYPNRREENWFHDRDIVRNETNFSYYDFYNGSFNISAPETPLWFEFHWNDTYVSSTESTISTTETFYNFQIKDIGYRETTENFYGFEIRDTGYRETTEYFYNYPKTQNTTTTYVHLQHSPSNYSVTNVTCYNSTVPPSESYPNFILTDDIITIYPYQAEEFNQINVTYTYTLYNSTFSQNATTTYVQLNNVPANYSSINVTCYNDVARTESYPVFLWIDTTITIYPNMADEFTQVNVTYTYPIYNSTFSQNSTYTYLQLSHVPINYSSINVTCYNDVARTESYPTFLLISDTITINPDTADEFTQVNVTYNYTEADAYQPVRCNRIQVAEHYHNNITFYIFDDKKVYDESTYDFNNSLVRYMYDFEDKTGIFINRRDIDTYIYIYTFTPNATRMIIHSEYWDTTDKVYPWLLFEKEYFIGVSCTTLTIDRVGIAPASTELNPVIIINFPEVQYYSLGDVIIIRTGWMAPSTGCYVYYQDTVAEIQHVEFRLYNFSNGSLAHQSSSNAITHNFTYPTACQHNSFYWIMIINHTYWEDNQTISGIIFGLNASINASYLNRILNFTFGHTPFRNVDTGQEIPWVYVLIFGVFFILLVSFAIINAYGAVVISSVWLMFSGIFFSNLPPVGLLGAAMLITAGCFLIIIAVLAALGGFGQK